MKCDCAKISKDQKERTLCAEDKEYQKLLCKRHYKSMRGLGDVVEWALKRFGIKQKKGCGCGKRKEILNKRFPMN